MKALFYRLRSFGRIFVEYWKWNLYLTKVERNILYYLQWGLEECLKWNNRKPPSWEITPNRVWERIHHPIKYAPHSLFISNIYIRFYSLSLVCRHRLAPNHLSRHNYTVKQSFMHHFIVQKYSHVSTIDIIVGINST